MGGLARTLIQGSFFRVLNLLTTVVAMFLMTPFVISVIGDRWYGLWVLATSVVYYYAFFDLGLSQAVQRFVSQALGMDDHVEANRLFNTCLFLFMLAGAVILAVTGVLLAVTPRLVKEPAAVPIFRFVILLVGIDTATSFPVRAFDGYLYAALRYDIMNIVEMAKTVVRTVLIFFFLGRGYGIIGLSVISCASDLLEYGTIVFLVLKLYPSVRVGLRHFARARIRSLLHYSVYSFISNVADRLRFQFDTLIIGGFLGLSLVTHYNIGSRFAQYYLMLITSAIALMMPVFSAYEAQNDYAQIRKSYLLVSKLNAIISLFCGGLIFVLGKPFMVRWMGPDYLDSYAVLVVLTIGLICNTIQITAKTLLYGLSKHKPYAIILAVETGVKLLLSLLLVKPMGIMGVALGTTLPMIVTNVFIIPYYTNRVIDLAHAPYVKMELGVLLLNGAVFVAGWYLMRGFLEPSYERLVIAGALFSVVLLVLDSFILLTKDERKHFRIPI